MITLNKIDENWNLFKHKQNWDWFNKTWEKLG